MIALERIEDADESRIVLRDAEPYRIGSPGGRKMRATAASVAEITTIRQRRRVRLADALGIGAAEARIQIAQTATRPGQSLAGVEVRTSHGRYISMDS